MILPAAQLPLNVRTDCYWSMSLFNYTSISAMYSMNIETSSVISISANPWANLSFPGPLPPWPAKLERYVTPSLLNPRSPMMSVAGAIEVRWRGNHSTFVCYGCIWYEPRWWLARSCTRGYRGGEGLDVMDIRTPILTIFQLQRLTASWSDLRWLVACCRCSRAVTARYLLCKIAWYPKDDQIGDF